MRPIVVPAIPAGGYDENRQLEAESPWRVKGWVNLAAGGTSPSKKVSIRKSKRELAALLEAQIDDWAGAGAVLSKGAPVFATQDAQSEYAYNTQKLNGGSLWGGARRDLITALGQYCSYCGSSVFSHLAIEHRLPKSTFPGFAFSYRNFLLACSTCNSAKGNDPNQGTVDGHPLRTDQASALITDAIEYLWPDADWTTIGVPARLFPYQVSLKWLESKRNTSPSTRLRISLRINNRPSPESSRWRS
jgi:hypothetical protein